MPYLISFAVLFLATASYADEIRCYSNGVQIYKRQIHDCSYIEEGLFVFTENNSDKTVVISGDCVMKIDN